MTDILDSLIDEPDTFELVRDQVAMLLSAEVDNQQQLAANEGKDPDQWKLRVYSEHSNPFEQYLNTPEERTPLINVWFDNDGVMESRSNTVADQTHEGTFNVDCFGRGYSRPDGSGHVLGDRESVLEAQRAMRISRAIVMAGINTYLQMPRGVVAQRMVESRTSFQPVQAGDQAHHVAGARMALRVRYNEASPQVKGEILEQISTTVEFKDTGEAVPKVKATYNVGE